MNYHLENHNYYVLVVYYYHQNHAFLLIDEGTSNIDIKTDNIIQNLLKSNKKLINKTIGTIAHRINTVLNYNKIISIKNGQIIEFDTPKHIY